jgi:hypothetical protein
MFAINAYRFVPRAITGVLHDLHTHVAQYILGVAQRAF